MILVIREQILNKLISHREQLVNSVINGSIQDFPSYRNVIGKIRGVDDAIEIIKEIFIEGYDGTKNSN